MAPQILHRVIHGSPTPEPWQKEFLTFRPAVLHGFRRHRVRGADYPGIVPVPGSGSSISQSPSHSVEAGDSETSRAGSVLGTVVSGLTDGDVHRLDIFEGSDYVKETVRVRVLRESLSVDGQDGHDGDGKHLRDVLDAAGAEFADEGEEVTAATYVFIAGGGKLEEAEWNFEAFKRDKMAWWVTADESEW